jgi:hypothetical protein
MRPYPWRLEAGAKIGIMKDVQRPEPDPVVEAYKKDIDRTLIRENLKLTVEDRFRKAMAVARFADEMRRAGREARSRRP